MALCGLTGQHHVRGAGSFAALGTSSAGGRLGEEDGLLSRPSDPKSALPERHDGRPCPTVNISHVAAGQGRRGKLHRPRRLRRRRGLFAGSMSACDGASVADYMNLVSYAVAWSHLLAPSRACDGASVEDDTFHGSSGRAVHCLLAPSRACDGARVEDDTFHGSSRRAITGLPAPSLTCDGA